MKMNNAGTDPGTSLDQPRLIETLWSHVHALTLVDALGSYTAAARRLSISKATMSQRIAELERAAGVAFVRRTTRSVALTDAGRRLVQSTRSAFAQIGDAYAGVKDLASAPQGVLRVTAPVALGRQQLVGRLAEFAKAHPAVRVELDLSDRLAGLVQEGFDLAIRHTERPPDTHVAWALCETRSVLVATRTYLKRCGTPRTPADLARHACLHYLRPGETPVWHFAPASPRTAAGARVSVAVQGPLAANNSEALREAAMAGLGIALLPDFSAQACLRGRRLVEVLPGWRPVGAFGSRIYALRPYSPYVPRAVAALVDYLRESLRGGFAR
jgi:DNA-binding transcriptional LysR family regulator